MPLSAGARLGNVVLREPLGKGAMGTVWLAHNESLGSDVAVKVLHAARALDDDARARFEREARGLAQLNSPHVVRVFDYGITDEGEPFIVMERLVGRDLKSYIEHMGPLPRELTLTVMRQLCRALRYAHERGVLHRDIKPANVFLVEADGEPFVKVLDFGIAKYHAADMELTETGQVMGTPYYMSPEQFMSPRDVDHRSDLWSAAVVAYACMVGKLPFVGEAMGAISVAAYTGDYRPPTEVRPALPSSIDAWVKKAFSVDPGGRFGDAGALYRALEEAYAEPASGEPVAGESAAVSDESAAVSGESVAVSGESAFAQTEAAAESGPGERTAEEATNDDARTLAREPTPEAAARSAEEAPSRRWLGLAVAATLVLAAVGLYAVSRDGSVATADESGATDGGVTAATAPIEGVATSEPRAAEPQTMTARLGVSPADVEVRVNGSLRTVRDGAVELAGLPGDTFVVEVSLDGRRMQHTVVMKRDGETSPASVELAAPRTVGGPPPAAKVPTAVPSAAPPAPPVAPPAVKPREGWP